MTEETEFWNEWLKTPEGSGYRAGYSDYHTQNLALRGKLWVAGMVRNRLNRERDAVLSLCVRERLHPECDPAVRWVVELPGPWGEGYPTREAACEAVLRRAEGGE